MVRATRLHRVGRGFESLSAHNFMTTSIVYEDDNILVLNKPSGLITHPKNSTDTQPSITSWLIKKFPQLKDIGEPFIASGTPISRVGVVHRLDKDTSGLILVAKSNDAFLYLKNLFQTHQIRKSYQTLVYGKPKNPHGVITAPLGRIGLKRTTQIIGNKLIDEKDAITEYAVLKSFPKYTLLDVSPKTGRTHQIRVHLKSIGCPIAGDPIYTPKGWQRPPGLNRLFLHAYKLEFKTSDGKQLVLEADLPEELQRVINMLE